MTDQTSDRSAAYSDEDAAAHTAIVSKSLGQQQRPAPMGTVLDVLNQGYEIIKTVAGGDPVYLWIDGLMPVRYEYRCIHRCGGTMACPPPPGEVFIHGADCPYLLAKDLLERHGGGAA